MYKQLMKQKKKKKKVKYFSHNLTVWWSKSQNVKTPPFCGGYIYI